MPKYEALVTKYMACSVKVIVEAENEADAYDEAFCEAFDGDAEWDDPETTSHEIELTKLEEEDEELEVAEGDTD